MLGNSFQPQFFDYTDPSMDPLGPQTGGMPANLPGPMPGNPAQASGWTLPQGVQNTMNAAGNFAGAKPGPQKWASGINLANTASQAMGGPSLLGGAGGAAGAAPAAGAAGAGAGAAGAAGGSGCGSMLGGLLACL